MSPEKLIYMANQVGKFFAHQPEDKAVVAIADHLASFWDPRMRAVIFAHLETGGEGLSPTAKQAVERLRQAELTKAG